MYGTFSYVSSNFFFIYSSWFKLLFLATSQELIKSAKGGTTSSSTWWTCQPHCVEAHRVSANSHCHRRWNSAAERMQHLPCQEGKKCLKGITNPHLKPGHGPEWRKEDHPRIPPRHQSQPSRWKYECVVDHKFLIINLNCFLNFNKILWWNTYIFYFEFITLKNILVFFMFFLVTKMSHLPWPKRLWPKTSSGGNFVAKMSVARLSGYS